MARGFRATYDPAMGTAHSLRKLVKETSNSTCTRVIFVEVSANWISVKVDECLTDWTRSFPNTSRKVSTWLSHSLEDAELYASDLFGVSLLDGFVRAC
jgi:hypothetical protein